MQKLAYVFKFLLKFLTFFYMSQKVWNRMKKYYAYCILKREYKIDNKQS